MGPTNGGARLRNAQRYRRVGVGRPAFEAVRGVDACWLMWLIAD